MKKEDFYRLKQHKKFEKIFSRYFEGIRLSETMVYSATREKVANKIAQHAKQMGFEYIVDACGGAGGNSIAFARAGLDVCYVEIDEGTMEDAINNAEVYEVADQIYFEHNDMLKFDPFEGVEHKPSSTLSFTSPEWGGPSYKEVAKFDLENLNPPLSKILEYAKKYQFRTTMVFAPRNADLDQAEKMGCNTCMYMFLEGWCDAACLVFDTSSKEVIVKDKAVASSN